MTIFEKLALESQSDSKNSLEREITVYADISNQEGLKKADRVLRHTDYMAYFEKDGCKSRLRVIEHEDGTKINEFTIKVKQKSDDESAIEVSSESTINVDDNFVEAFKTVAEEGLTKTRYEFNTKSIQITYSEDGIEKVITVPNVIYEVDVFDNNKEQCKIDIEVDTILDALDYPSIRDKKVMIRAKVSHLPFAPVNIFAKFKDGSEKIKEFWGKAKG